MSKTTFETLQKPTLWQRSDKPFWDDEHISKFMLSAHLAADNDLASRKKETIEKSVEWISSLIPDDARLLDLGCGPGLYVKRFADRGYKTVGVDMSKRSIAYAKEQDDKTQYLYMNYLQMDYVNEFDVIIMIYCDFAALTKPEREILLAKAYKALKPNGIFFFDVFTDKHYTDKMEIKDWTEYKDGGFWSAEPYFELESRYFYENDTVALDKTVIITQSGIDEYLIWDTVYDVKRLSEEVAQFGFCVKNVYDDVCGKEYSGDSETLCAVLTKSK